MQSLESGDRVFYPAHGVAVVVGVEERVFGDQARPFFALDLDGGDKVLLPVENVEKAGVRVLVSVARARKMLQQVAQAPTGGESKSRRQRVASYKEDLRTGAADSYTSVLQRLLFRARSKKLAMDEKRVLEEARAYFVSEVSVVLDVPRTKIATELSRCVSAA